MFLFLFLLFLSSSSTSFSFTSCPCECNTSSIIDPFNLDGYGKYTGIRHTCSPIIIDGNPLYEEGCDGLDDCSRSHDICIGKYGYLSGCPCNIELIKCSTPVSGDGFKPCEQMMQAKAIVVKYICDVILYDPVKTGGCNSSYTIPSICF